MAKRTRIGLLTPSSNTVMEPRVGEILRDIDGVTAHFGRFRVKKIDLGETALGQFSFEPQLIAADLLADAKCDVIVWGGTSGGWLGADNDRKLCAAIREATGTAATTTTLATLDALKALGARSLGLATPYLTEVQNAIQETFGAEGFPCVAERHLGDPGNFSFANFSEDEVAQTVADVAAQGPDAVAVFCTNFDGPRIAPMIEQTHDVAVLDSISVTLWHALRIAGRDTAPMTRWGRIFAHDLPGNTERSTREVSA